MTEATIQLDPRTRLLTWVAVAGLHLVAIVALVGAFGVETVVATVNSIATYDVPVPPPPAPPQSEPAVRPDTPAAAAPPAPKATARPAPPKPRVVVAPKPSPSPVVPAAGAAPSAGAGTEGSGSGAAGRGSGTGSGGSGAGGGTPVQRAEKLSGELRTRDFPRSGADERDGRFIVVRYRVGVDGRVGNCRVVQSSGSAEADAITCRLVTQRFRYRPARDAAGEPVPDETGWKQWWWRPE